MSQIITITDLVENEKFFHVSVESR
jgi:hypothetical protein